MIRSRLTLSPEVSALLGRERGVPPLPPSVRARGLARARATLGAAGVMVWGPPRAAVRTRWAAAALVCVASATVGAAAYQVRARLAPPPSVRPISSLPPVEGTAPPSPAAAPIAGARPAPARAIAAPRPSPPDALRAELRLLRQARTAVARDDFAAALPPIAAHAHRFENGRLAEEREGLRVKALAGLGRTEEARRAAAGFEARFPHSVLLPAIRMASLEP